MEYVSIQILTIGTRHRQLLLLEECVRRWHQTQARLQNSTPIDHSSNNAFSPYLRFTGYVNKKEYDLSFQRYKIITYVQSYISYHFKIKYIIWQHYICVRYITETTYTFEVPYHPLFSEHKSWFLQCPGNCDVRNILKRLIFNSTWLSGF